MPSFGVGRPSRRGCPSVRADLGWGERWCSRAGRLRARNNITARMNKAASPSLEHRVTAAQVVCKKLRTVKDPDAYFDTAQHEFSVALRTMSLDLLDSLDRRLNALGEKVARLEATTRKVVISRDARAGAQEIAANFAAQQERAEKSLLSLWLQGYVRRLPRLTANANDHEEDVDLLLDAVDFAFCRCALNVAISSSSVSQEKLMSSRVVSILISMVDGANKVQLQQYYSLNKSLSHIRQCNKQETKVMTKALATVSQGCRCLLVLKGIQ